MKETILVLLIALPATLLGLFVIFTALLSKACDGVERTDDEVNRFE